MSNTSLPDILKVGEIIDLAFGEFEGNTVNFKLVQTILFILANHMRLLERHVQVEFASLPVMPRESLSVTEVKIHAMQGKKKKPKDEVNKGAGGPRQSVASGKFVDAKTKKSKPQASSDKTSTQKTDSSDKTSTDKTFSDKTYSDKTSSDKKTSSSDKTSTDKTSSDKKSSSSDKTSSDKKTSSSDKTSSDKKTSSSDKTSTDKTFSDKTSSDKKTSSSDKTSTDKTSSDKTSTQKTSSSDKTSSDKKTSSSDKTSTDKSSSSKTKESSKDKSRSKSASSKQDQDRQTGDPAGEKTSAKHAKTEKTSGGTRKKRADSFEQATKSPTPMTSVGSMEKQHGKLLVVQRVPSGEARQGGSVQGQERSPQISVVTQEQFEQVAATVRQLQHHLLPVGTPGFPEHAELMEELRRGASLTDAMAALQLSARLEATEKSLGQMISMVTELARQTPGVEIDEFLEASEAQGGASKTRGVGKGPKSGSKASKHQDRDEFKTLAMSEKSSESININLTSGAILSDSEMTPTDQFAVKPTYITYEDLKNATKEIYNNLVKQVTAISANTSHNADNAYRLASNLEKKLESSLSVSNRMMALENLVSQYADAITALDTGLSSQMTNYQEQLTQMQHDLEIGLETMAEALANTGGDTVAMAELNSHFTSLQLDFDNMMYRQKDLRDAQDSKAYDLENLWKEIEMLRDTKADREEVADALRDKAGIGELNGLVSLNQFDAVRGDFEKRIGAAYDKFNNQEMIWQKAIDDLIRELHVKADLVQVESLQSEINKYLNNMKHRMQILIDIVGEPKSAMLSKKLFRNTACLSCGSPAHMAEEEPNSIPALPPFYTARQPGEGAEVESKPKGDGDSRICYPDFPIPHPRDPRSHVCRRYCGGSHTTVNEGPARVPPLMIILQPSRQVNRELGTDGKLYLVDEVPEKIPCLACNKPKRTSLTSKYDQAGPAEKDGDATPPPTPQMTMDNQDGYDISVTPPALEIDASDYTYF